MAEKTPTPKPTPKPSPSPTPTPFDVMGAFNNYYTDPKAVGSLSVVTDFGKSIPKKNANDVMGSLTTKPTQVTYASVVPVESSFFSKVLAGMEKAYNLSAQAATFSLNLGNQFNPLNKGWNLENLKDSWKAAGEISPGQAFTSQVLGAPVALASEAINAVKLGDVTGANKFIKNNLAFGDKSFNIYDKSQRDVAFSQQAVGRFTSWGSDVVARFTIDPTIFAGKAVKAYRTAGVAVKDVTELKSIIAGEQTGIRSTRIKNNFDKFIKGTDGMEAADLFRVKAIRESSNPGSFAEVMAEANKIEDVAIRHKAKTNIVLWAMGDPKGAVELMQSNKMLATKIANLQDEIVDAKYLGSSVDKATGQLTMDLLNTGENAVKHSDLAAQYELQIAENLKELSTEGILSAKQVPVMDMLGGIRREFSNSQKFIDLRGARGLGAVYSSYPVRLMTGFFYKRPKGWIDFTDNQSAQTLDNMLSRVRGISDEQETWYKAKIAETNQALMVTKDAAEKEILEKNLKEYKRNLDSSTFTVERKNELFDRYISAIDPVERANVYQQIEQELFNTVAKQFGYDQAEVNKAWAMFSDGRGKAHNLIRERAYTGKIDPETGGPIGGKVTPIAGTDGASYIIPLPLNETQLAKQLPTLDIDSMYRALNKYTRAQRFEKGGPILRNLSKAANTFGKGADEITDALDSIIKFEVLARLGYPVRNVGEGFLRILQVAGPMAIMARVGGGIRNTIGTRFAGSKVDDVFKWSNEVKLRTFREELEGSLHVADDPAVIERQIAEINAMLDGKIAMKDKFGVGLNEINIDGEVYRLEDALGATPEKAKYIQDKFISNAAKIVDSHFGESSSKLRNIYETNGDFVIVKGTDPQWEDAYLRVINRQVRQSKLTSILLQNKPREVLVREAETFLQTTPEGRNILKNLALGRDVESIVEANMQNVESLFPSWIDPQLKNIAAKRNLTSEDLKQFYGNSGIGRPDVNGAQVSLANGTNVVMRGLANFLNNFYHYMGEVPESELVRNPLFVDTYRKRLRASMENAVSQYPGERIPPEYLRKVENEARQFARSESRRTLYDTSERVDSAHMLKYVFPFFGAWADVTEKWGRMILDDPSVFRKLQTTYASPDRTGLTEERDGITYINIPGSWGKRMGLGDRPLAIPKPSLNLIFQGGAWWNPGAGWFVQYPLSVMIKATPDLERNKLVKQVLPYGADGTGWQDFLIQSSAARRALAIFDENNPTRSSLTVLITAEENHKYDMGERDKAPTAKEIDNKVRKILALEAAARLTLPFATNTRSPYQFYIDEYHRMRQEDPQNAGANFYDQYGDQYFIFATNLSKNNTGINATIEADKRTKQFSDLIAKNPEYGWFIVGDANAGEFSPTVYQKQRETPVRPGSKTKQRESQDPYEAIAATNAEKGWIQYNKGIELLESQRIARGLKSINSKGAEDLAALKKQFIADLEAENNDWAIARGKIDTGRVINFLKFADKAVKDVRLKNRPDMKLMADYLEGRAYIMQQLAQRKSQSLDNAQNADLKAAWDEFTGQLVDEDGNGAFTRIYSRILEKDDLRKGL